MDPATLPRIGSQHERIMRGRQMEAVAKWPVAEQIRLARQIMGDITEDSYQRMEARKAAAIALDAIDETEHEMGHTRHAPGVAA